MTDDLMDDNADSQVDPNKDYLKELVGDGKKFKTVEDLARGKYEADLFINFKNKQFDEMRDDYLKTKEQLDSRASLEELVNQLKTQQLTSSDDTNNANEAGNQPKTDPNEIRSLMSSAIQEHEMTKKQTENYNMVRKLLQEQYGTNYKSALKQQTESLGLSDEDVNAMARSRPAVLIKALGLDAKPQRNTFQAPPQSTTRNDSFAPRVEKRDYAYYQTLKQKSLSDYLSPKTQSQMQKDAIELGDSFYN